MKKNLEIKNSLILGWKFLEKDSCVFWYKGYLNITKFEEIFKYLQKIEFNELKTYINNLDGNFSFIFKNESFTLAVVDKISSIPIYYFEDLKSVIISPHTFLLKNSLKEEKLDPEAVLSLNMSGYTVGNNTLYGKLKKINCGEFFFCMNSDSSYILTKYYTYLPSNSGPEDNLENYKKKYIEGTLKVFQKLHNRSQNLGKKIAISMSAGLDTRLIVSALKEVGAKNIIGFSYGLKNNFEANAAKKLCKYLDIPWKFSRFTNSKLNKIIKSKDFLDFRKKTDTYYSTSDYSDYFAIKELTENNFLNDSIIVNGHSGDFIAGNHMLTKFYDNKISNNYYRNGARAIIKKHFRLWLNLANEDNDSVIENLLIKKMKQLKIEIKNPKQIFGVIENIQLEERQSKHCLSRQRNYENFGLDWALPLWDNEYLKFWEKIPYELKLNRKLYIDTLYHKNFQKVWKGKNWEKLNTLHKIDLIFIRILRIFTKIFFFFSKEKWKLFDKKYFTYWYDNFCSYAHVSYLNVIFHNNKFRNGFSWQTKSYLEKKKIDNL